jgi:RNA polymerase sigma-70 factor (ECF subfamily)
MTAHQEATGDLETLFHAYYGRLARLLYRVTGDMGRAEEVAAEAFWRLHRKPPPAKTNFEGWLYRTGLRLALDHVKREGRRARYEALASFFGFTATPEQTLQQIEERERVRQALTALKPEQVALLTLRGEGYRYAEIAAALNCHPASVGTLLARAEQAFRKEYVNRYGER